MKFRKDEILFVNYFYEKKIIRGKTNDGKYITVIHFKLKRSEVGMFNIFH